jgi:transposase
MASRYVVEHLNHLGIVAEVCREIGVAAWLNGHDPASRQRVSVGTATVALVLNGLGWSNRQLYLVPQFFADKPVEHLLGPGIHAEDLNDDCLGRTLDWLYAHNVTTLFAGLALRARRAFGITVDRLHADTTSFSVHGQYARSPAEAESQATPTEETVGRETQDLPTIIEVTYGYSRDHRADLKQWMLALITSGEGVPQFLRPLDGQASDKRSLLDAVLTFTERLKASGETPGVYVADSGIYSCQNMTTFNTAGVLWASRVPETMTEAQAIVREEPAAWQTNMQGTRQWWSRVVELPQGLERWIVVRSQEGVERARATLQRQAARDLTSWTKHLWHLGNATFACQADAEAALAKALQRVPVWVQVQTAVRAVSKQAKPGRPRKDAVPATQVWQIQATVALLPDALEAEALRRAAYIIGTNLLETDVWPEEAVIALYHEQTVAEKGFAFLKDPLFLASSVFVKKPERIMALAFIMVLCLLVYKLAELRVRQRLAATGQTVPDQVGKPSTRPTMRWLFQCFEGLDLHYTLQPDGTWETEILRLTERHRQILHLLGPTYAHAYLAGEEGGGEDTPLEHFKEGRDD